MSPVRHQRAATRAALRFVPIAAAALLLTITSAATSLVPIARSGAIAVLIIAVLFAVVPKRVNVKTHGAIIFATIAVAITGLTRTGPIYPIGCAIYAWVAVFCLRAPSVTKRLRPRDKTEPGVLRDKRPALILATFGALVALGLIFALPAASAFAERQVQRYAGNAILREEDRIGFATNIRVGSLNHVLKSDRVVMRLSGRAPERLRGVVLDTYDRRVWSSSRAKSSVTVQTNTSPERATTHIELSRSSLSSRAAEPRWFLADDACNVWTPSGRMFVDPHGEARPDPPTNAREIGFSTPDTSACEAPLPSPAPPSRIDLELAPKIRFQLSPIAADWTRAATTKQEALDAIAKHLSTFEYSLDEQKETRLDPIVEFLTIHKKGHCEFFASAMALLARSAGIPARVVVGYRVDEVNRFTGLSVVRDRNAHSWVEAWDGERWMAFDPTPLAEVHSSTRPSTFDHVSEAVALLYDRALGFVARLTLLQTGLLFAFAALVLIVIRRLTQAKQATSHPLVDLERPLPAFEVLTSALERSGLTRTKAEPIERFAKRVHEADEPWSSDVASVLQAYADLRYGNVGEEQAIAARLTSVALRISATLDRSRTHEA